MKQLKQLKTVNVQIFGLVQFMLRPCQHENSYIDGSQRLVFLVVTIQVLTEVDVPQLHSERATELDVFVTASHKRERKREDEQLGNNMYTKTCSLKYTHSTQN